VVADSGRVLTLIVGAFSILAGHPWLVPSLGPTAYMQAEMPSHPSTRLYNVLAGHVVGLLAGFFCVWLFAAKDDPIALTTGDITWERVLASALALALTIGVLALLRASHPPAAATALLVGLGSIHNTDQALYLALGALVIAVCGELMRHLRLGDLKTWQPSLAMQRPRFLQPKAARPIGHGHA
jgi:CBS-domain-containing membrane protein